MFPKLTLKQRVIGFSICLGIAALFAVLVSCVRGSAHWMVNWMDSRSGPTMPA